MAEFILEIRERNSRTKLPEWRPLYPDGAVFARFRTYDSADRRRRLLYPQNPPNIRVAAV